MKKYEHAFGKNDIRGIYGDVDLLIGLKSSQASKNLICGLQLL